MPTKTTSSGVKYEVSAKAFTWHPADENNERGNLPDVHIPLRIKLKAIRALGSGDMDAASMFSLLEQLIPDQSDSLDEMDMNDFMAMFSTWQDEYSSLSGATLGE